MSQAKQQFTEAAEATLRGDANAPELCEKALRAALKSTCAYETPSGFMHITMSSS